MRTESRETETKKALTLINENKQKSAADREVRLRLCISDWHKTLASVS